MQAILAPHLYTVEELGHVQPGDFIDITKFEVRRANRLNGDGTVIHLAVQDCELLRAQSGSDTSLEGGFIRTVDHTPRKRARSNAGGCGSSEGASDRARNNERSTPTSEEDGGRSKARRIGDHVHKSPGNLMQDVPGHESDIDDFETACIDLATVQRRRQALHQLDRVGASTSVATSAGEQSEGLLQMDPRENVRGSFVSTDDAKTVATPEIESHSPHDGDSLHINAPSSMLPSVALHQNPAPLHNLVSLLQPTTPLLRRNYCCSVFAVISWVSPSLIHKQNSPFPPKRHIRIHDSSISNRHAGVTVAIFVEAQNFMPNTGTIALFRGVTMHRWEDDIILNAYASLRDAREQWYVDDEDELKNIGHDVDAMRKWWDDRQMTRFQGYRSQGRS